MKRNHREMLDRALAILYAWVPEVACRGLCGYTCTAIDAGPHERHRVAAAGVVLPLFVEGGDHGNVCPALRDGRCSTYEVRPMICRLWGATSVMPCPHGCERTGDLAPVQVLELISHALNVGRDDPVDVDGLIAEYERNPTPTLQMFAWGRELDRYRRARLEEEKP
jgi:hypothetical protein